MVCGNSTDRTNYVNANTPLSNLTALFFKTGLSSMLTDMNIHNTETATKNHNLTGQTKFCFDCGLTSR